MGKEKMIIYEVQYIKGRNGVGRRWAANKREIKRVKRDMQSAGFKFPPGKNIVRHDVPMRQNMLLAWLNSTCVDARPFPFAAIAKRKKEIQEVTTLKIKKDNTDGGTDTNPQESA
jgi:hypothetical protein